MAAPHMLTADEGTHQTFMPGEEFTWKTTGASNGGALDFAELTLHPQVRTPQHVHHGNDEAYFILAGNYRFKVGDEIAEATDGGFVFIPRGTPHAWVHLGPETGRAVLIFTPGGMVDYFKDLAPHLPALMSADGDMSKVGSAELASAEAIMRRHQFELVGPPLS
ncbi:MAG: hypothetical protein NVS3B26_09400 [Mycobacteriales bacterium]